VCLGVTRDVARLLGEGRSLAQIRAAVDMKYGRYGPPTPTPRPPA
jgi:hypothetical protein